MTSQFDHETEDPKNRGKVGPFYWSVRKFIRTALNVFYRTIEITGLENIDVHAPTILACNHPNSIIDPLLLGMVEQRQVSFCARDGLFKIPGFGALLRSVGAIPLRRRSDHGGGSVDNAGAFSACRDVLLKSGVLAIFPEGKTHSRMRIEPLKTGTARIAIDAVEAWRSMFDELPGEGPKATDSSLRIVPVGITYLVRHAFLSDVHIAIGKPIHPAKVAEETSEKSADQTVRQLTDRIQNSLQELAVHIENEEDERFIAQVTAIVASIRSEEGLDKGGQSPAERTALTKRVLDAYRLLKETDPIKTDVLRQRLERYMEERRRLGLGGERATLQHRGEGRKPLTGTRLVRFFVLGAPIALYGLAVSLVPYVIVRTALRLVRLSTYRVALFKLLFGLSAFTICWTAAIALIAFKLGPLWATLFGLSLLPSAFFSHRFVTETRLHRVQLRSLDTLLLPRRTARLRAERAAISAEIAELRKLYLSHLENSNATGSGSGG